MALAALFLAALVQSEPINLFDESLSDQTRKRYEAYLLCFAKGDFERRRDPGSPETHMKEARAACQKEYDAFVAGVVKDSQSSPDSNTAAARARALLDEMDTRAVIGPPPPADLAQLPVEQMVGHWRMGGGPLALDMNVQFSNDGSLVGTFTPDHDFEAEGLRSWRVTSDGTRKAAIVATFADGRSAKYERIPSFPSEMDFINAEDPKVQRIDLALENNELLLRLAEHDRGAQLRFHRQLEAAQGPR